MAEEILKAAEICLDRNINCRECPLFGTNCTKRLANAILAEHKAPNRFYIDLDGIRLIIEYGILIGWYNPALSEVV